MAQTVYLHYTQEELNRNFDQRTWASNALEVIARYARHTAATRARLPFRASVPYGPGKDETADVFAAQGAAAGPAPVQVFVHGGAWKNFTKEDYSYVADSYAPYGIVTVVLDFTNLPAIRLPGMVDQVRRGLEWTRANIAAFGGDPSRIYVSAHSSGAHLAACAVQKVDFVQAATLVSGPYFLEPVLLSHRSEYVKLEGNEPLELSPGLHAAKIRCPVLSVYAENDTDEFRRQTQEFAKALQAAGKLQRLMLCKGQNHFELMERWADPEHELPRAIRAQMGLAG